MMKANKKKSEKKAKSKVSRVVTKKAANPRGPKGARAKGGKTGFRAIFMENILFKKRELEKTLEHLMDSQREYDGQLSGGDFIDEFDRAQREISASSYYPLIERKIKELQKIELLIHRMSKEKKFGLCEECGKPIPKERLLIIPEATLCVSSQRELEKMDHQKSVEARMSTDFEGGKGLNWENSTDFDNKGHLAMKTQIDTFSVADIRGTETEKTLTEKG
jgi:RNA polymerase-binding transcription factor DksA